MNNVQRFIKFWSYKPTVGWSPPVRPDRCCFAVQLPNMGPRFYQCTRKVTEVVEGYPLCTQHAKLAKSHA